MTNWKMIVDTEQDAPLASDVVDLRSIPFPWTGITVVTNNSDDSILGTKFLRKVGRYADSEGGAYMTMTHDDQPNFLTIHRTNKKNDDDLPVQWIQQITGDELVSGDGELALGEVVFVLSPLEMAEYQTLDWNENVTYVYVHSNQITAHWDSFIADAYIEKQKLIYRFTTE